MRIPLSCFMQQKLLLYLDCFLCVFYTLASFSFLQNQFRFINNVLSNICSCVWKTYMVELDKPFLWYKCFPQDVSLGWIMKLRTAPWVQHFPWPKGPTCRGYIVFNDALHFLQTFSIWIWELSLLKFAVILEIKLESSGCNMSLCWALK